MSKTHNTLTLSGSEQQHVILSDITYQGSGAYDCRIAIESNGFMCRKAFNFDNDEYFLAKLQDLLAARAGEAELLDLASDNVVKLQALGPDKMLVSGLILEEQPFAQTLEFAFLTSYTLAERFADDFARLVRANS